MNFLSSKSAPTTPCIDAGGVALLGAFARYNALLALELGKPPSPVFIGGLVEGKWCKASEHFLTRHSEAAEVAESTKPLRLDSMPFPLAPPSTPLLKDAIWVTEDVQVTHESGPAHSVKVKYEVEVRHEPDQKCKRSSLDVGQLLRTPLSNDPWKLCYVAADDIEPIDSDWGKITSAPGMYVLGKRADRFYEVALDEAYVPWLLEHSLPFLTKAEFEFRLCYDPTQPTRTEVEVYGWGGFYTQFLKKALKGIWAERGRGLESCLRFIAPLDLQLAIEQAILSHDILTSEPHVQGKFTFCLVLLGLSLLKKNDTPSAIQLLEKDQDEVLQPFRKDLVELLRLARCQDHEAQLHFIGLTRHLLILAGGPADVQQLEFDQTYTTFDDLDLLGSLLGIARSSRFRNFESQMIISALSKSNAITNEDMETVDLEKLLGQLMMLLQIGYRSDLDLSTGLPSQLPVCDEFYATSPIHPLRVLGNGLYELDKGFSDRKLVAGDIIKLRLGGVAAGFNSQTLIRGGNVCLPSPLKDDMLTSLFVDYDGWYEDHHGTQQRLPKEVLRVVHAMKVGQKILILEDNEDSNSGDEKYDGEKETRIWVIHVLQVLQVCAGHLSFGRNVALHPTMQRGKPKTIKRAVRQRIGNKLQESRVERSGCGLVRFFRRTLCKFLCRSSSCGYEAL